MSARSQLIANAVIFQATWFACVIGGAAGQPIWGFLGVGVLLGLNVGQPLIRADLWIMAILAVVGFAIDTAWIALNVLSYEGGALLAPAWILALWLAFALTVNHSMAWLQPRPWLAGLLAAVFAPVTYLAGERLGAVTVVEPLRLGMISAAWGIVFTLVFGKGARMVGAAAELSLRQALPGADPEAVLGKNNVALTRGAVGHE